MHWTGTKDIVGAPISFISLSIGSWKQFGKICGNLLVAHCHVRFACRNIYICGAKKFDNGAVWTGLNTLG